MQAKQHAHYMKLNKMLKMSSFHRNICTEMFAPLINCVIDDVLLEAMLDIDQALLQFVDIMNLVDQLLHFYPYFVVSLVHMCRSVLLGGQRLVKTNCLLLG